MCQHLRKSCAVPKLDARPLNRCFLICLACVPILVDHAAEDAVTSDRGVEGYHGGGVVGWRVLVQALVWAVIVEVAHVPVEDGVGMSLVVDQHPVGAFGADAADEPFRVAVRLRRPRRDLDHVDAFGGEDGIEGGGEFGVPVADEEAKRAGLIIEVHQEVAGGLGGPGCGRVGGHAEEMDPAGAKLP